MPGGLGCLTERIARCGTRAEYLLGDGIGFDEVFTPEAGAFNDDALGVIQKGRMLPIHAQYLPTRDGIATTCGGKARRTTQ